MGYHLRIERRARSKFLQGLRDPQMRSIVTILDPVIMVLTYARQRGAFQLDQQDLLYNRQCHHGVYTTESCD